MTRRLETGRARRNAACAIGVYGMLTVLAGCGGSSDSPAAPVPVIPAVPAIPVAPVVPGTPSIGTPAGTPVTRQIGPSGGTIATADSGFSVVIPAGAIATATNITIRPYVNTAPNAFGLEYAIEPANLQLAKRLRVKLSLPLAVLGAVDPSWVGLGVRRNGVWYADVASTAEVNGGTSRIASKSSAAPARSLAAAGNAGFDVGSGAGDDDDLEPLPLPERWTTVTFWKLEPATAVVRTGQSLPLSVKACTRDTDVLNHALIPMIELCTASIREATWSVNARVGGNDQVGRATAGSPRSTGRFLAPTSVPSPRIVNVTATMFWRERGLTSRPLGPIPITIIGGDFSGTASGSVASKLAEVGTLFTYTATVVWDRVSTPGFELEIYRPNPAKSWIKYVAVNRCISRMTPDSVPILATDATLTVNADGNSWTSNGGGGTNALITYYDTCGRSFDVLPSLAPFIGGGGTLPVKGQYDLDFGLVIKSVFNYPREGEGSRVAPRVVSRP